LTYPSHKCTEIHGSAKYLLTSRRQEEDKNPYSFVKKKVTWILLNFLLRQNHNSLERGEEIDVRDLLRFSVLSQITCFYAK